MSVRVELADAPDAHKTREEVEAENALLLAAVEALRRAWAHPATCLACTRADGGKCQMGRTFDAEASERSVRVLGPQVGAAYANKVRWLARAAQRYLEGPNPRRAAFLGNVLKSIHTEVAF